MSIGQRLKPYTILCYEALFRMLKEKYRYNKILNQDYGNYLSGYLGERQVDYKLGLYPSKDFLYYPGLRLTNNKRAFQMDSVLLSTKFILILETKNWKGKLKYHPETNSITQIYQNVEKSYQNPMLQVQSHEVQLSSWLQNVGGINGIPIESLVVISDSSTLLEGVENNPQFYNKVIYADNLISKINDLKIKYTKNYISKNMLGHIHKAFIKYNSPLQPNLIKQYNLNDTHFIYGIPCKNCSHYPMKRQYKTWKCDKCNSRDPLAHIRVILDYFLLFNSTITNRECRKLLHIQSDKTAHTILNSLNLKQTGKNKARKYHAPSLENYPQQSNVPNKKTNTLNIN